MLDLHMERWTHGHTCKCSFCFSRCSSCWALILSRSFSCFFKILSIWSSGIPANFQKNRIKTKIAQYILYQIMKYSNHPPPPPSPYTINSSSVYTYHGLVICSSDKTCYYPDLVELSPPSQCAASPVLLHVLHPSCFQSYSFLLSVVWTCALSPPKHSQDL